MLKNQFLAQHRDFQPYRYNLEFFHNVIELFGLDDEATPLAKVRRKNVDVPKFTKNSAKWAPWITGFHLFFVPLAVAACGLLWFLLRRSASIRYERAYIRKHNID